MTERQLSPTDAALRARIKEICVHIPCGRLRGPVPDTADTYYFRRCWQSCMDEDAPESWEGCDVSRAMDLCIICARGTAGGASRWSWLACADCRAVNTALPSRWGLRPFALGRHSLMNGIGVRGGVSPDVQKEQRERLKGFVKNFGSLEHWHEQEYRQLAGKFDPLADIPLRLWQQEYPPGRPASWDAFSRLTKL
ncbi:hypothetical protein [Mycobacterium sp.]|uniref:hypothetical protein n=1 Tax=Mycobacterium sp. TaxID=1785 RepID=UPI0031D4516B